MAEPESLLDFSAYGLNASEVRSAAALSAFWQNAVHQAVTWSELASDEEFASVLERLPKSLTELEWQRQWIRLWDRLSDAGVAAGTLFQIVFKAVTYCERGLFGNGQPIRPMHFELCLVFRKVLLAACCGAIDARELIKSARGGIPGEVTALHTLQTWAGDHQRAAVLSLSLLSHDKRSHLGGTDLQQLPGMIFERLQGLLRPKDMIFTGHENEWLVLLPEVETKAQPSLAAALIERAFIEPLRMPSGRPVSLSVAIGVALMPEHGRTASSALQSARLARWGMKPGAEGFAWYRPEQAVDADDYVELVKELRQAIEHDRLQLFLQPQVNLDSNQCVGAELLLRWQRQNGTMVPPPEIIELIQHNGWQALFTDWLIRMAMRIAAELETAGVGITLSVNLTADNLLDPELPDILEQRLQAWDLPGNRFILELTESAMMGDQAVGLASMERLRALGFELSLDDFGTGYSSLSYLVALPIHELKVDRSFVISMFDSGQGMQVVKTIIGLANELGMVPLAEGIDDPKQLEALKSLGCQIGQGYLFARPMPLKDFIAWYKAWR